MFVLRLVVRNLSCARLFLYQPSLWQLSVFLNSLNSFSLRFRKLALCPVAFAIDPIALIYFILYLTLYRGQNYGSFVEQGHGFIILIITELTFHHFVWLTVSNMKCHTLCIAFVASASPIPRRYRWLRRSHFRSMFCGTRCCCSLYVKSGRKITATNTPMTYMSVYD